MDNLNIEAAIEAILFTMGDSVEISKITNVGQDVEMAG